MRILVVDDHHLVRTSLRDLLSLHADWSVCGEAENGIEAVAQAKALQPDIILMDISMPQMDGLKAASILRVELPQSRIVLMSQDENEQLKAQARRTGAAAFLAKKDMTDQLIPLLERIFAQDSPAS